MTFKHRKTRSCFLLLACLVLVVQIQIQLFDSSTALQAQAKFHPKTPKPKQMKKLSSQDLHALGQQKLNDIQKLEAISPGNIIRFTIDNYYKYVTQNPRPYDVVILFSFPKQYCKHCDDVYSGLVQTVYSFNGERGKKDGGISQAFQDERKIFFGILMFEPGKGPRVTQRIFEGHGFMEAQPSMLISPLDLKRANNMKDFYSPRMRWVIRGGIYDSQAQINFINGILSTDVQIKQRVSSILARNVFLLAVLGGFCFFVYQMYEVLLMQWMWFAIASFIYMHGCGGIWFALHNRVPIFRWDVDDMGRVYIGEYFNRSNMQWIGEAWLIGGLSLLIAAAYIFHRQAGRNFNTPMQKRLAVWVSLYAIYYFTEAYFEIYRNKQGWHRHIDKIKPDDRFIKGPVSNDQMMSIP